MCVSSTTSATRISPATHLNNKELMKQMPQLLPPPFPLGVLSVRVRWSVCCCCRQENVCADAAAAAAEVSRVNQAN